MNNTVFRTLQIPTTLPTLDELLGRPEFPEERIIDHYVSLLQHDRLNVLTIHAEIEGMKKSTLFRAFLERLRKNKIQVEKLDAWARDFQKNPCSVPVCDLYQGTVDGRSGTLSVQQCAPT